MRRKKFLVGKIIMAMSFLCVAFAGVVLTTSNDTHEHVHEVHASSPRTFYCDECECEHEVHYEDDDADDHEVICNECDNWIVDEGHNYDNEDTCIYCGHVKVVYGEGQCPNCGTTLSYHYENEDEHIGYCSECDEEVGDYENHIWDQTTNKCTKCGGCKHPSNCISCIEKSGDNEEHTLHCSNCNSDFETDLHDYEEDTCVDCGHVCTHNWDPEYGECDYCDICCEHLTKNYTNKNIYKHTSVCATCGYNFGEENHNFVSEVCTNCGANQSFFIRFYASCNDYSGTLPTFSGQEGDGVGVKIITASMVGNAYTLPGNIGNLSRSGYNFIGWNTDQNANSSLNSYNIPSSTDVSFYAIWEPKTTITVTSNIANNTYTYDKCGHSFEKIVSPNLLVDVKYATHIDGTHSDSDWTTTAPVNAGTYDVRVIRAEDNTYAKLDKVCSSALIINQKEVGLEWADILTLEYTGSELKPTCTAIGILTDDVCTVTVTGGKVKIGDNYVATASSLSNSNYKLPTNNTTANFTISLPVIATNQKYYDKKGLGVTVNTTDDIKNTFTYEYKLHSEDASKYTQTLPVNAGSYDVRITRPAGADYNAYYIEHANYVVIHKKELEYKWTNTKFIYDGNPHLPTVEITNLESGDVCNLTVTGTQTDYSKNNYYAVVESCDNPNYDITSNNQINFTIYAETLYYNMSIGKLVYVNSKETKFVATEFENYYSVSEDHKTITLKNINHVLDYEANALYFDTHTLKGQGAITEALTIVLEGTNTLGCNTSSNYGVKFIGDITIKGEGTLNIHGGFSLDHLMEVTNNVLNVESGTINIETIADTEQDGKVTFVAESQLNMYGGKITVYNPLKINKLFQFEHPNFLLYAAVDKNSDLTLLDTVDYDSVEGRYQSSVSGGGNTINYYYIELRPLTITQEPTLDNGLEIKTNIDSNYQWYVDNHSTTDIVASDISSLTDDYIDTYSNDPVKGWTFSNSADDGLMICVMFDDPQYTAVEFTTNEKLSLDFADIDKSYDEFDYELLTFIKEEEGIYYYEAGFVTVDSGGDIIGYFVCCLDDEDDDTMEINNVKFVVTTRAISGATSSAYSTPTESGKYFVKATKSFATVTSQKFKASEISYDVNGGTGSVSSIIRFEGNTITLNDGSSLSRTAHGFLGWNTDKNATTALSNTYVVTDSDVTFYAIWQATAAVSISEEAQTVEYSNTNKNFEIDGNIETGFVIKYATHKDTHVDSDWSVTAPISIGSYDVMITRAEDDFYYVYSKQINNGLVITPKEIVIDWCENNFTYNGNTQVITASYKDVSNNKVDLIVTIDKTFKDAGSYTATVSFKNNETNYKLPASVTKTYTMNKLAVSEPTVSGTYKYTGNAQTVTLNGVESYMTTVDSLSQTKAGVYTINYTLDNNHKWADGSDGSITWEIKAVSITPKAKAGEETTKQSVIVETAEGFDSDITVTVEITIEAEIEQKELTVDYYKLSNDIKLASNEKVGTVFDVKLIQTVNGVSKEIQPSDIKAGTKITVKMLIPDTIDVTKVTRILHVHAANDIDEIEFDASKIDADGYYAIEVSKLSEFAFIYQKDSNAAIWIIIAVVVVLGLAAAFFLVNRKVSLVVDDKVVKELKVRPLQKITLGEEFKDYQVFTDKELTNALEEFKMGFKPITLYVKEVK